MRVVDMNWMQVEEYLKHDDRCVLPLGCTEQHSYLSLGTDSILAEKVAIDAAEPLGVPVFPVVSYGITPFFKRFPGSISVRVETYVRLVRDILDTLAEEGFKRIVLVNGHGGNTPANSLAGEWMVDHPGHQVKFTSWYDGKLTWAKTIEIDPVANHASWMENFPWTRLANVALPAGQKPPVQNLGQVRLLDGKGYRAALGDGNYGGLYERSDEEMLALWKVGVEEVRLLLTDGWAK